MRLIGNQQSPKLMPYLVVGVSITSLLAYGIWNAHAQSGTSTDVNVGNAYQIALPCKPSDIIQGKSQVDDQTGTVMSETTCGVTSGDTLIEYAASSKSASVDVISNEIPIADCMPQADKHVSNVHNVVFNNTPFVTCILNYPNGDIYGVAATTTDSQSLSHHIATIEITVRPGDASPSSSELFTRLDGVLATFHF